MKKKTVEYCVTILLMFYFLMDATQKVLSGPRGREEWVLNHKFQQMETTLLNRGLLLFEFSWLAKEFGGLILFMVGLIEGLTTIFLFVSEDDIQRRINYALILCAILLFDSFAMHMPLSEQEISMASEYDHVWTNLGIAGGLLMLVGVREYPRD